MNEYGRANTQMETGTLKNFIPPILLRLIRTQSRYGYFGKYETWEDALKNSQGYDTPAILEKVKNAVTKVKNGEAVYERDSVIFNKKEYSWPVLTSLLWIASHDNNRLKVLDFGGSLGSSYFQNKNFLSHIDLTWYVAEQDNFVACGKKFFEDAHLKFVNSLEEVRDKDISVFLASSSLQYIQSPYAYMQKVVEKGFPYILIDRTAFLHSGERLTIQKVRPDIYEGSYPAWFLNEEKFKALFTGTYSLVAEFESIGARKIDLGDTHGYLKGFLFKHI